MGFRTLEISRAAELHIKEGQLVIESEDGVIQIPVEDLNQIMVHGANIRLSTMDLSILSQNKVMLTTFDEKYLPTAAVIPFTGHSRQSRLMHAQVSFDYKRKLDLWLEIIKQKIINQSRALVVMGREGAEDIAAYADLVKQETVDGCEAFSAKQYFQLCHKDLNRRATDPINSRLNYGYAVVRSAIARSLVSTGFHPTFGLYHNSQLNAFNLADDLIEPFRPMVDLTALAMSGSNQQLTKKERGQLALVLHQACLVDGVKVNMMTAIDLMTESLKRIMLENSAEKLKLPVLIPIEMMKGVTE